MKTKLLTILLCVFPALIAAQNYEKEGDDLYAQSNYELAIKKYNAAQVVAGESASVSQKIAKAKKCNSLLNQARLAEQRAVQSNSATDYEKASQLYANLYAEHASTAYKSKSAAMKQKAESVRSQVRAEQQRQQAEQKKLVANNNCYAYVDLGLSVKWATCNVGAANPWDYGDYFAWGETVGYGKSDPSNAHNKSYTGGCTVKTYYDWETYKYCSRTSYTSLTKYNYSSSYGSVVDNKYTLDLSDDAARVNMGGSWRMPTIKEQRELLNNCYWEWTDSYSGKGVKGYIVYKVKYNNDKGKKKYGGSSTTTVGTYSLADPHIFLPAAGCRYKSDLNDAGLLGFYWSSSLYGYYNPSSAYYLYFYSDSVHWDYDFRYYGRSVRAVVE